MGLNGTMAAMSARLAYDTLPRVDAMSDDARSAARAFDRAADTISGNPRSLLFGAPPPAPGPGEAGFAWSDSGAAAAPK
jgi:phospholipid/cholesterol/gamma-HCH transport system substrate-binding protein